MNDITTWLTADPCPACGTALHGADTATGLATQQCPACGWTADLDTAGPLGGCR